MQAARKNGIPKRSKGISILASFFLRRSVGEYLWEHHHFLRESSLIMGIDSTGCGIGEGAAGMDLCAAPQRQKK